jgi:hypothetical protein
MSGMFSSCNRVIKLRYWRCFEEMAFLSRQKYFGLCILTLLVDKGQSYAFSLILVTEMWPVYVGVLTEFALYPSQ